LTATSPALAALSRPRALDRAWIGLGLLVSALLHTALAATVASLPDREREPPRWLEMAIVIEEPAPEPAPPPEPEPEPEPVPLEPEAVAPVPTLEPPPPKAPRPIQGLSNDSFLPGSGSGISVRAGNTTALPATQEIRSLDEPSEAVLVPLAKVTQPPKLRYRPTLEVPDSVKQGRIEGRVELLLTIDASGLVLDVQVVTPLSPEADAACVDAMRKSRWKPGDQEGVAVATSQVPSSCYFDMTTSG
jgi:protein TonB